MIHQTNGNITIDLDMSRINGNLTEAHKKLNMQVVADATPYTPFQQGQLRSQIRYPNGLSGDLIEWYAPYAHYQYYGTVYTDTLGRTFVNAGETKNVNTGRPLSYHEPGTGDHWVERAKQTHLSDWIALVKRTVGRN